MNGQDSRLSEPSKSHLRQCLAGPHGDLEMSETNAGRYLKTHSTVRPRGTVITMLACRLDTHR